MLLHFGLAKKGSHSLQDILGWEVPDFFGVLRCFMFPPSTMLLETLQISTCTSIHLQHLDLNKKSQNPTKSHPPWTTIKNSTHRNDRPYNIILTSHHNLTFNIKAKHLTTSPSATIPFVRYSSVCVCSPKNPQGAPERSWLQLQLLRGELDLGRTSGGFLMARMAIWEICSDWKILEFFFAWRVN